MKKEKPTRVSVRDIAHAAGVSKTTAGDALQNRPSVNKATRERIQLIARKLGYVPDPRMAVVMASVQGARAKDFLPVAWLNTHWHHDSWKKYEFLSPYLAGAHARAREHGYRVEEIWLHEQDLTMRRLAGILYQRNIEGVIVTQFAKHLRLNWDRLAGVSLEGSLLAPLLDRVAADTLSNLRLALKMVKRFGYKRVGVCLAQDIDNSSPHGLRGTAYYFQSLAPVHDRVEPLFYPWGRGAPNEEAGRQMAIAWIRRNRPEVIIAHSNRMLEFVEKAGFRVPEQIGVVHLATDDDVSDWAGIHSKRREIGAAAMGRVISLLQNRRFGVPQTAENVMIRGTWHGGGTLLAPRLT